jgi:Na+/H+ antiporter NhaD/arsenite permease-like protein
MIPLHWMAIVAGIGLAIWILGPAYALLKPMKQRDPQAGQAIGCLALFIIPGVVLAMLLVVGLVWDVPVLIRVPYYCVVWPLILIVLNAAGYFVMKAIKQTKS